MNMFIDNFILFGSFYLLVSKEKVEGFYKEKLITYKFDTKINIFRKIKVKNEETWDIEKQKYLDILKYRNFKKVAELYCIPYGTLLAQVRRVKLILSLIL